MNIFFILIFNFFNFSHQNTNLQQLESQRLKTPFQQFQKNNIDDVLKTQEQRFTATIAQDSITLYKLLDKDLHYIHSNALLEDKAKHIDAILKQRIVYQAFIYENEPSVLIKKNIAIINGVVNVKGLYAKSPFDTHLYFMAIYKKEKKTWRLLKWQSTKKT